jgi:CHAT domain-containing protein
MVRFYELWLDEQLPPAKALARAQIWMAQTTNEEKIQCFSNERLLQLAQRLPPDVYGDLQNEWEQVRDELRKKHPQHFKHPVHWAGFYFTGL